MVDNLDSILESRKKLIVAMKKAAESISMSYVSQNVICDAIDKIQKDSLNLNLSVSVDDPTKVAYSKPGTTARIKTSLQRYFRRQLEISSDLVSDAQLDRYCSAVYLLLDDSLNAKVKLIAGDGISGFYSSTNIGSCMVGSCHSYRTALYSLNPDKVKMAVFDNCVRALLWTCDGGEIVLDRAYPSGHWGVSFIRTWATNNGYLLRDAADFLTEGYNNTISDKNSHIVTLNHTGIFPYMDTFKYGKIEGPKVILSNDEKFGNIMFTSTDGSYSPLKCCAECGVTRKNTYELLPLGNKNYCRACYAKHSFRCPGCSTTKSNEERHLEYAFCTKCYYHMNTFLKFNKCDCYTCANTKTRFNRLIGDEVIRVSKIKWSQLQFDFA